MMSLLCCKFKRVKGFSEQIKAFNSLCTAAANMTKNITYLFACNDNLEYPDGKMRTGDSSRGGFAVDDASLCRYSACFRTFDTCDLSSHGRDPCVHHHTHRHRDPPCVHHHIHRPRTRTHHHDRDLEGIFLIFITNLLLINSRQ